MAKSLQYVDVNIHVLIHTVVAFSGKLQVCSPRFKKKDQIDDLVPNVWEKYTSSQCDTHNLPYLIYIKLITKVIYSTIL